MGCTHEYEFETGRLSVKNINSIGTTLAVQAVQAIFTAKTTHSLPPSWQGAYDYDRSRSWLSSCSGDDTMVLCALDKESNAPLGLIILFELPCAADTDQVDLRLGYVLSESSWGRGFATELVRGLVARCRCLLVDQNSSNLATITGGVDITNNPASKRVLEKCGFVMLDSDDDVDVDGGSGSSSCSDGVSASERVFQLRLSRPFSENTECLENDRVEK